MSDMNSIVLLSGGLDSMTSLAMEIDAGRECTALSIEYGQRNNVELDASLYIAQHYHVPRETVVVAGAFRDSPLTNRRAELGCRTLEEIRADEVSPMVVPGRNLLLLAFALSLAERLGAERVVFSPNRDDRAFPDCSPAFVLALQAATPIKIHTPLIEMTKAEVVTQAVGLGAPCRLALSCYQPMSMTHCGRCDACVIRLDAFEKAGHHDPADYTVRL